MTIATKEEVAEWFEIDVQQLDGAEILFAQYECGNYEGEAFVLLRRGTQLYEVNGSHCSCYGLEGQWGEEETSYDALMVRYNATYGFHYMDRAGIKAVLDQVK